MAFALPLTRALQKARVCRLLDPCPGGARAPREAPQGPPWAFPGPRWPPRGLRDLDKPKQKTWKPKRIDRAMALLSGPLEGGGTENPKIREPQEVPIMITP